MECLLTTWLIITNVNRRPTIATVKEKKVPTATTAPTIMYSRMDFVRIETSVSQSAVPARSIGIGVIATLGMLGTIGAEINRARAKFLTYVGMFNSEEIPIIGISVKKVHRCTIPREKPGIFSLNSIIINSRLPGG